MPYLLLCGQKLEKKINKRAHFPFFHDNDALILFLYPDNVTLIKKTIRTLL